MPTLTLPFGGADDVPVGGDYDGDGTTDLAVFGYSPDDGAHRFGIIPSLGSPTRAEPFGAPGAIGLPPFSGLFRVQGGVEEAGARSGMIGVSARRASGPANLVDPTSEPGDRPPAAPRRPRWAGWFATALRGRQGSGAAAP
jgi:hypothetical protein